MSFVASEIGNHRIEFGIINATTTLKPLLLLDIGSLFVGGGGAKPNTDCARRKLAGLSFGQEFDSPRLHQKESRVSGISGDPFFVV